MNPSCSTCVWTVAWDEAFFRIVQSLFSPQVLEAASGLLASYDDTCENALTGSSR
jgi:hypothetical protein